MIRQDGLALGMEFEPTKIMPIGQGGRSLIRPLRVGRGVQLMTTPEKLLIPYEDSESGRFTHVGRYGSDNQFMAFITGAFPRDWWSGRNPPEYLRSHRTKHKRWYAVLHRFDSEGNHSGTEVRPGGTTAGGEPEAIERARRELEALLSSLGAIPCCDIWVRPFGVEVDGYFFGLVYTCEDADDPDDPDGVIEYVMLEPNDIMFHPPWDSGEYST